ncbi:hypothetical protein [Methanobrevibacter arboriphilus]|uniref:hypothetical protein n=1 Tax=Methanobrevibacter arboriphilus TaxID=39441 RepID=UPI000B2D3F50|nr:hypothetical protein [Methanobrevibacter arboriphilus]
MLFLIIRLIFSSFKISSKSLESLGDPEWINVTIGIAEVYSMITVDLNQDFFKSTTKSISNLKK